MELLKGETLAERLKRSPLPVDEALAVAQQIAAALEAAHERAVVHRDLKPGNIILLADGKVKVLDFGLAKAFEDNVGKEISNLPTLISSAATKADVIFGTAAYMSPEQVKGKTVDRRTDIWAFGVVLYEMLTGKQPFSGDLPRCRYCVDTTRHTLERVTRITPAISRTKHCLVLSKPGKRPTHAKGRREVVPVISLSPGTESRYWLEGILNASLPRRVGFTLSLRYSDVGTVSFKGRTHLSGTASARV